MKDRGNLELVALALSLLFLSPSLQGIWRSESADHTISAGTFFAGVVLQHFLLGAALLGRLKCSQEPWGVLKRIAIFVVLVVQVLQTWVSVDFVVGGDATTSSFLAVWAGIAVVSILLRAGLRPGESLSILLRGGLRSGGVHPPPGGDSGAAAGGDPGQILSAENCLSVFVKVAVFGMMLSPLLVFAAGYSLERWKTSDVLAGRQENRFEIVDLPKFLPGVKDHAASRSLLDRVVGELCNGKGVYRFGGAAYWLLYGGPRRSKNAEAQGGAEQAAFPNWPARFGEPKLCEEMVSAQTCPTDHFCVVDEDARVWFEFPSGSRNAFLDFSTGSAGGAAGSTTLQVSSYVFSPHIRILAPSPTLSFHVHPPTLSLTYPPTPSLTLSLTYLLSRPVYVCKRCVEDT